MASSKPTEAQGGSSLLDLAHRLPEPGARGPAPVEQWNPDHCGDVGLSIDRDGVWRHQGDPILRERLVRLFATVLRKDEDGKHYLVTPVEKIVIHVVDAPFLAVAMRVEGSGEDQRLVFTTNVGDEVTAGADHPIAVRGGKPYLRVRGRLDARLTRAVYYELAELAENGRVTSDGQTFRIDEPA